MFIRHGQTEALVGAHTFLHEHLGSVAREVDERSRIAIDAHLHPGAHREAAGASRPVVVRWQELAGHRGRRWQAGLRASEHEVDILVDGGEHADLGVTQQRVGSDPADEGCRPGGVEKFPVQHDPGPADVS